MRALSKTINQAQLGRIKYTEYGLGSVHFMPLHMGRLEDPLHCHAGRISIPVSNSPLPALSHEVMLAYRVRLVGSLEGT